MSTTLGSSATETVTSTKQFFRLVDKRGELLTKAPKNRRLPELELAKLLTEASNGQIYYNADADNRHRAYGFVMFDGAYYSTKRDFHSYREPLLDMLIDYHEVLTTGDEYLHRKDQEDYEFARRVGILSEGATPTQRAAQRLHASILRFGESNSYYSAALRAMKDIVEQPLEFFEAQAAEWLLDLEEDVDYEYRLLKRLYERAGRPGNLTITDLMHLLRDAGAMVRPDNDRLYRIGAPHVQRNLAALT